MQIMCVYPTGIILSKSLELNDSSRLTAARTRYAAIEELMAQWGHINDLFLQ